MWHPRGVPKCVPITIVGGVRETFQEGLAGEQPRLS